jgi:O-antigen/teichoic acid export membrane protein
MEVLGLYSLTKQLVLRLFNVINPIITNVLSPWLASLQAEQKKQKNAYLTITRYLAYLNFPLYLIFTTGSFEILYLLYGPSYVSGTLLLFTLAIYYSILSITNPVGSLQIATGRTDLGFYWTLFRASITPIALLFGIQLNGVQGIAWVLLGLSVGLLYPLWWFQIRTMLPMSFRQYLEQFYRPLFSYLLLGFSVHFIVKPMLTLPNYVGTLIILLFVLFIQIGSIYIYDRTFFKTMQSYWQK